MVTIYFARGKAQNIHEENSRLPIQGEPLIDGLVFNKLAYIIDNAII